MKGSKTECQTSEQSCGRDSALPTQTMVKLLHDKMIQWFMDSHIISCFGESASKGAENSSGDGMSALPISTSAGQVIGALS